MRTFFRLWRCKYKLLLLIAAFGVGILLCDWRVGSASSELVFERAADAPQREVALVLGTAKYASSGRQNVFYGPRIDAAAELYHAGKVRGIVVSGDHGRTDYNEPGHMKEDLIARGVPAEHITCDYAGFRTLDSVHRVERVFQQSDYIVVSQAFHVKRALYIAHACGHDAVGVAVASPRGYWGAKIRFREVLARVKAVLDVRILRVQPKFLGDLEPVGKRAA